ncbi:MAG TPA: phenylalanine--tRNA ligase subunit beta [Planctomycetaceae bacterium]|nr:phenylalanine--tRNA ligase subunit beta [Planctomycetaceae bacterium]
MIVSWNWLKEYVRLDMPVEELGNRLMMAGLNLESIDDVEGDIAIDLEVTSNRPDCLCHLGVARETAALFERDWTAPNPQPATRGTDIAQAAKVAVEAPDLCPLYTARLVRGVKIAPSPLWMQRRLKTLGIRPINNVVDVTNYVLMECSQPLHAFDFDKLQGGQVVVRRSRAGEKITAIDQKVYELSADMCVIADAQRPVAIAGVMGGFDTEIGNGTRNVLIEAADFASMSVRATARKLNLHSDSSYRFERGIDRSQVDWASRRCAQLILETAGGELAPGVLIAGDAHPQPRPAITLRLAQIPRVLGIDIPRGEVERILRVLGLQQHPTSKPGEVLFVPPSWRRDLSREIDLIEEAARVHGYDKIPEDATVPLTVSTVTPQDRLCERLTQSLIGAGFFEAVTLTFVDEPLNALVRPWTQQEPLRVEHSSRQRTNILRQSLVPSLLAARRQNECQGTLNAQLFEIARVFLAAEPGNPQTEPKVLSAVSGRSFHELKGVVEQLLDTVNHQARLEANPAEGPWFQPGRGAELRVNEQRLGWIGEISHEVRQALSLHDPASFFEIDLGVLEPLLQLSPPYKPIPEFPPIHRDINFVLDDAVSYRELSEVIRSAAGTLLEEVDFSSQYRGPQIPADKKSYVVRLQYRAPDRTLTSEEVDSIQQKVIAACVAQLAAQHR